MSHGERYLLLDADGGSKSRLCIRCARVKGLVGYYTEKGRKIVTFLDFAEPCEPYVQLPRLKRRPYLPSHTANDFDSEFVPIKDVTDRGLLQRRYDRLLHWCSAKGTGRLEHFHVACYALRIAPQEYWAWPILRRLTLLGYTESEWTGNQCSWGIASPAIVRMAADGERYFLTGQRIPALVERLPNNWRVSDESSNGGPTRKLILGDIAEGDVELARGYKILNAGCVSMRLAELTPDLQGWKAELRSDPDVRSHLYEFERYEGNDFMRVRTNDLVAGLHRVTRTEGGNQRRVCLFYDGDGRWLEGDFYGLRYLDAKLKGKSKLSWNDNGYVDVAEEQRWPFLYERALVLASGELPHKVKSRSGRDFLRYFGITEDLARLLCQKLDAEMVYES
jgi:hypothetical protein